MINEESHFILNKNMTFDEVFTHVKKSYSVTSGYLNKDQFCFISYYSNQSGHWIVVSQSKSKKLKISCHANKEDIDASQRLVWMALVALGNKVKPSF